METITIEGSLAEKYVDSELIESSDIAPGGTSVTTAPVGHVWRASNENWFTRLLRLLTVDIMSDHWQRRHGSCMCLSSLFAALRWNTSSESMPLFIVTDVLALGMCVLVLERFMDFGEYVTISPVKEVAAQLMANASQHCPDNHLGSLISKAIQLTSSAMPQHVHVSGLLLIKYLLPVHYEIIDYEQWILITAAMNSGIRSYNIELSDAGAKLCQSVCYCFVRVGAESTLHTAWSMVDFASSLVSICTNCSTINESALVLANVLKVCTEATSQCHSSASSFEAALQCVVVLAKKIKFTGAKLRVSTLKLLTEVLHVIRNNTAIPSRPMVYQSSACIGSLLTLILSSPGVDISGLHLETRIERDKSKKTASLEQECPVNNECDVDIDAVDTGEYQTYADFVSVCISLNQGWWKQYGIDKNVVSTTMIRFLFEQYLGTEGVSIVSNVVDLSQKPQKKRKTSKKNAQFAMDVVIGGVILPADMNIYNCVIASDHMDETIVAQAVATGLVHVYTEEGNSCLNFDAVSVMKCQPMGDIRLSRLCCLISALASDGEAVTTLSQLFHDMYCQKLSCVQSLLDRITNESGLAFVLRDDISEMYTPRVSTHHSAVPATTLKACYTIEQLQWLVMLNICITSHYNVLLELPECSNHIIRPLLEHLRCLSTIHQACVERDTVKIIQFSGAFDGYAELVVSLAIARHVEEELTISDDAPNIVDCVLFQLGLA